MAVWPGDNEAHVSTAGCEPLPLTLPAQQQEPSFCHLETSPWGAHPWSPALGPQLTGTLSHSDSLHVSLCLSFKWIIFFLSFLCERNVDSNGILLNKAGCLFLGLQNAQHHSAVESICSRRFLNKRARTRSQLRHSWKCSLSSSPFCRNIPRHSICRQLQLAGAAGRPGCPRSSRHQMLTHVAMAHSFHLFFLLQLCYAHNACTLLI